MSEYNCDVCKDSYEDDSGDGCAECCDHSDRDSHCCLICGTELNERDFARAYDNWKDSRHDD